MSIKTIAIIGAGAAGTTFFRAFIDECIDKNIINLNLIFFEKGKQLGPGLAYQDDLEELVINRPIINMSANPNQPDEFYQWMTRNRHLTDDSHYTSRIVFGMYLNEIFEKSIIKASRNRIRVRVIYQEVTRVNGTDIFTIETKNGKNYLADSIILCIGHNQPNDIYKLSNTPKYLNNPYPAKKIAAMIPRHAHVGILGNSLTAIDTAIALQKTGFLGQLSMFSRQFVLPRVRCQASIHQLQHLTPIALHQIIKKHGKITLRSILRLFRKELRHENLSWKSIFREENESMALHEFLSHQLEHKNIPYALQAIIPATNIFAEYIWNQLSLADKKTFLHHFQRSWLNHRSSIPPNNARLLVNLSTKGRLTMYSKIKTVKFDSDSNKYHIHLHDNRQFECDWVINATGPSKYIGLNDGLAYDLINQGIAKEHPLGGLDVDFESAALINQYGVVNPRIRLIGHNTIGVYQYTSSLELIAKKSTKIASNFTAFIKGASDNEIEQTTSIYSDRISHSTQIIA